MWGGTVNIDCYFFFGCFRGASTGTYLTLQKKKVPVLALPTLQRKKKYSVLVLFTFRATSIFGASTEYLYFLLFSGPPSAVPVLSTFTFS